jgi:hypothetical protein
MRKAAVVARSSGGDTEGDRVQAQVDECLKWAKANGYSVTPSHVFREENVSGRLDPDLRGPLQAAWTLLEGHKVDALIVRDYSRLGRRLDTAQLVQNSRAYGQGIVFVRTPPVDDPVGQAVQDGAWGLLSALEAQIIFQRTSGGRRRSMENGGVGAGKLPFWLRHDKEAHEIVLVEEKATEFRAIVDAYLDGVPATDLAARAGVADPGAIYNWIDNTVLAGRRYVWPVDVNPVSGNKEGTRRWKRDRERRRKEVVDRVATMSIEDADALAESIGLVVQEVPAIYSWEEWQGIVAQKRRRRVRHVPHGSLGLPLQKRATCAICGSAYIVDQGGSRKTRFFICLRRKTWKAKQLKVPVCKDSPRLRYDDVERAVADKVRELLSEPEVLRREGERYLGTLEGRIKELEAALGPTEDELRKLTLKRERLAVAWTEGDLSDTTYQREKDKTQREIERLEAQAADTEETRKLLEATQQQADDIRELLANGFKIELGEEDTLTYDVAYGSGEVLGGEASVKLATALDRIKAHITVAPDGIELEAALLPRPVAVGTELSPSAR